jgi:hypothetical protein
VRICLAGFWRVWTALHALLNLIAALPRVEDPWPRTIGIGFPFPTAGAGGVLGNVFWARRPVAAQNRATSVGDFCGFWAGAIFLLALFVNQLLSER